MALALAVEHPGLDQTPLLHHEEPAVVLHQGAVPLARLGVAHVLARAPGGLDLGGHVLRELLHRAGQGPRQVLALAGGDRVLVLAPAHGALERVLAQDHLRVPGKVFVHVRGLLLGDLHALDVPEVLTEPDLVLGLLPEDQDVGHHLGARVLRKRRVRQANRPHQVRLLAQGLPDRAARLGVQGPMAGDPHHEAAGLDGVEASPEKVVVDRPFAVLRVRLVVDGEFAEGEIRDHQVHGVVRDPAGRLEPGHLDAGLGVELRQDLPRDGVELHGLEPAPPGQGLRGEPQEVPHAGRGLEHGPAGEAQASDQVPDRADHLLRGVVGVEGALRGPGPVVVAHEAAQGRVEGLPVLLLPVPVLLELLLVVKPLLGRVAVPVLPHVAVELVAEHPLAERAPAHEPGQDGLLFRGGVAVCFLEGAQKPKGLDVGLDLPFHAGGGQLVVRLDAVVLVFRG